jgi:hypothetical protein
MPLAALIQLSEDSKKFLGLFEPLFVAVADIVLVVGMMGILFAAVTAGISALQAYNSSDYGDGKSGGARDYAMRVIWLILFGVIFGLLFVRGIDVFLLIAGGATELLSQGGVNQQDQFRFLGIFAPLAVWIVGAASTVIVLAFIFVAGFKTVKFASLKKSDEHAKAGEQIKHILIAFVIALTAWLSLNFGFAIISSIVEGGSDLIDEGKNLQ